MNTHNVAARWASWAPRFLGFWPIMNNGVAPARCSFVWLHVSAAGAGPWSLDAMRGD